LDTITHTLFGIALYRAVRKDERTTTPMRRSLLFTALVGSQIPDIDVISQWWDTTGQYLSWHRGLTHSVFLVPLWAGLIYFVQRLIWKVTDFKLFWLALLAVFIHDTSDLFNAWGTGYLEPFWEARVTFGTIPIVDLFVWFLIFAGFFFARAKGGRAPHRVFKTIWVLVAAHFLLQSAQGYLLYQQADDRYEQVALAADFVPTQFKIIGTKDDRVEILEANVWSEPELVETLKTIPDADLEELFKTNPKAKTLYGWAPFVVVVEEGNRFGIYDPRFYRDGQSFLFEYMERGARK